MYESENWKWSRSVVSDLAIPDLPRCNLSHYLLETGCLCFVCSQFHPSYSSKQEISRKQWELKELKLQLECPYIQVLAALTSLVAQTVKHLPAMRQTRVRSLGWEDPLEKKMAIHSSILAWEIPWMEEYRRLQSTGLQRVRHDWAKQPYLLTVWYWVSQFSKPQLSSTKSMHAKGVAHTLVQHKPWINSKITITT